MKVRRMITLFALSIISITLIIFSWLDFNAIYRIQRKSYAIIGGADGPTSIILSDPVSNYILYGVTAAVIAVTIVLTVLYRKKK